MIIVTVLMVLISMAGTGGGGIMVPIIMIFFKFDTKNAMSISGFAIVICQITKYIIVYK